MDHTRDLTKKFTMRVDAETLKALDLVAADERLSRSDTIRRLIFQQAERIQRKHRKENAK